MRLDERVVRDMFKNIHDIFIDYKNVGISADEQNDRALEMFACMEKVMERADDLYEEAYGYIKLLRNDPPRYGFCRGELEAMILEIDREKQLIDDEREIYNGRETEYLGPVQ